MKSPIIWVGGKNKMVNILLPLIPKHKAYIEVFGGGGGYLLFGKEESKVEILNDFDSNLMNFFKVIKSKPQDFIDSFNLTLISRELYNEYKAKYKSNAYNNEVEQAHIFYYLLKVGFGGDMKSPTFGTSKIVKSKFNINSMVDSVKSAYQRLNRVTIENKSFEDIFKIYDGEDSFFYLDPPYRNTKQYATGKFTDEQYKLLADCCRNMKGKFLMTINDDEYIRELFKDFNIMTHEVYYSVCKTNDGRKKFGELIIANYNIEDI